MELELEVPESEDYSEFPACEQTEIKLCQRCKRKAIASAVDISVVKEDKTTQTISRKVWRKQRKLDIKKIIHQPTCL